MGAVANNSAPAPFFYLLIGVHGFEIDKAKIANTYRIDYICFINNYVAANKKNPYNNKKFNDSFFSTVIN